MAWLGPDRVETFFTDDEMCRQDLGVGVTLALADSVLPGANAVRLLNAAGIPVIAIPLVAAADGDYLAARAPQGTWGHTI